MLFKTKQNPIPTGKDHKELLQALMDDLEANELPYYATEQKQNMWGWRMLAALSIFLPLLTSLCAYFGFKQTDPGTKEIFTGLAFVLPLFTSLFSTMQNVFKVRENEALREYGRIEVRDIILNGRSLMISCKTDEEFQKGYHAIRERAKVLEINQHEQDVRLRANVANSEVDIKSIKGAEQRN